MGLWSSPSHASPNDKAIAENRSGCSSVIAGVLTAANFPMSYIASSKTDRSKARRPDIRGVDKRHAINRAQAHCSVNTFRSCAIALRSVLVRHHSIRTLRRPRWIVLPVYPDWIGMLSPCSLHINTGIHLPIRRPRSFVSGAQRCARDQ
jgi:hypothetical protein